MLETNDLLVNCPKCGAWPMAVGSHKDMLAQPEITQMLQVRQRGHRAAAPNHRLAGLRARRSERCLRPARIGRSERVFLPGLDHRQLESGGRP